MDGHLSLSPSGRLGNERGLGDYRNEEGRGRMVSAWVVRAVVGGRGE